MNILNNHILSREDRERYDAMMASPVKVLQIGEGNFLRGFVDWMLHVCREQGLYAGSVAVTQPRPSGKAKIETLARQDGLYTLVTRGIENGERVERKELITIVAQAFDPYSDWQAFLALADSHELEVVVSNTTEAGLVYRPEPYVEGEPIQSFPGKVAALLYRRYRTFRGAAGRGLVFLPCELLERNGDELKACVLRYLEDWALPDGAACREWVLRENRFLNSLVDRIVTGHPGEEQANAWFAEWGYTDAMVNTAEPYHFWAIEGEPELEALLPLRQAGLNVVWTDDLKPFQLRKVRILNGAHTLMTPLGLLYGLEHVGDLIEHPEFGPFVEAAVGEEIIPAVPMPEAELRAFAAAAFERFRNPYIRHRLADIAMNSVSKFKTRLLPVLVQAADSGQPLPRRLVLAFAALLRYYRVSRTASGEYTGETLTGAPYGVRDDAGSLAAFAAVWAEASASHEPLAATIAKLLGLTELWGRDLNELAGLRDAVLAQWEVLHSSNSNARS
ncbi:tagaturonate reductase [Paenibacillus sp. HJGM_3]|uniref:tagaturonate reductase n=1 Tax=Paenibacillus sp. HJGM_3 TaxID=3379816 RepID=UPI00385DCED6